MCKQLPILIIDMYIKKNGKNDCMGIKTPLNFLKMLIMTNKNLIFDYINETTDNNIVVESATTKTEVYEPFKWEDMPISEGYGIDDKGVFIHKWNFLHWN